MARPKHRSKPGAAYFVTTNTWQRRTLLRKAAFAEIVEKKLFEYMPDHFHLILTPGDTTTLEKAVGLIKGGSSYDIGKEFGAKFPVWHAGFTEHQICDQADYDAHVRYIDMNPVKKGLADTPAGYEFGSACGKFALDSWPVCFRG